MILNHIHMLPDKVPWEIFLPQPRNVVIAQKRLQQTGRAGDGNKPVFRPCDETLSITFDDPVPETCPMPCTLLSPVFESGGKPASIRFVIPYCFALGNLLSPATHGRQTVRVSLTCLHLAAFPKELAREVEGPRAEHPLLKNPPSSVESRSGNPLAPQVR